MHYDKLCHYKICRQNLPKVISKQQTGIPRGNFFLWQWLQAVSVKMKRLGIEFVIL